MQMSAIAKATNSIAILASMRMDLAGEDVETALNAAAQNFIDQASDARARRGAFARETTSAQLEDVMFLASVAHDILDGDASRPSTGNVRAYALSLI